MTPSADTPTRQEWNRLIETVDVGFAGVHRRLDDFGRSLTAGAVTTGKLETRVDALERGRSGNGNGHSKRDSALIAFGLLVGGVILKLLELLAGSGLRVLAGLFTVGRFR